MPPSIKRSAKLRFALSFPVSTPPFLIPTQPAFLPQRCPPVRAHSFHDYFVTHLPSSSLHPDSRSAAGPGHKLPRDKATPHSDKQVSPAQITALRRVSRDLTVVRIPLKSAKHHFGASCSRGTRPYNEDTYQAGTIDLPAFAQRDPVSLIAGKSRTLSTKNTDDTQRDEASTTPADGTNGDPQVFYFSVFDGHGGDKCSIWLKDNLHGYLEQAAKAFSLTSSLVRGGSSSEPHIEPRLESKHGKSGEAQVQEERTTSINSQAKQESKMPFPADHINLSANPDELQTQLVESWRDTVGGYFKRFKPEFFSEENGGQGCQLLPSTVRNSRLLDSSEISSQSPAAPAKLETVLNYAFLRADLDFSTMQASETSTHAIESTETGTSTNDGDSTRPGNSMSDPSARSRQAQHLPFLGGSTGSVALISTPSSVPFWAPSSSFTLVTAHIGDTRILLCSSSTGAAIPLTSNHHPSLPSESARLRRYGGAFTTDSFGEERVQGLANTRSFGDARSKRVGVSAEPELRLLHSRPGEFSFLVLASDGVTGTLNDQEIVDIVKEAKTPEQGSRDVVGFATEVGAGEKGDADNATCMVVRLGGWERRSEGGGGGLNTREEREWRRREATVNFRGGRK